MKLIFEKWWLYIPYRVIIFIPVIIIMFFSVWYEITKEEIYDPIVGKWLSRTRKEYDCDAQPPGYKDFLLYNDSWSATLSNAFVHLIISPFVALLVALFVSIAGAPLI